MLDKLNVKVPAMTPWQPEFGKLMDFVVQRPRDFRFRQTEHYHLVGDLRPYGYPIIFHGWNRHKQTNGHQTHKLEFVDTGKVGFETGVLQELERVVDVDPLTLDTMRADVCVDLEGVGVDEIKRQLRVKYKQRGGSVGSKEQIFADIWKGRGETFYYGARGNCIRVYNKAEESLRRAKVDFNRAFKRKDPIAESLAYQIEILKARTDVVTRVEREMQGAALPGKLNTVARLWQYAKTFDPFENVVILARTFTLPSRYELNKYGKQKYTFAIYEAGLRMQEIAQLEGVDYAVAHIRMYAGSNAHREIKKYMPFLQTVKEGTQIISRETLTARYQDSVARQMAA